MIILACFDFYLDGEQAFILELYILFTIKLKTVDYIVLSYKHEGILIYSTAMDAKRRFFFYRGIEDYTVRYR